MHYGGGRGGAGGQLPLRAAAAHHAAAVQRGDQRLLLPAAYRDVFTGHPDGGAAADHVHHAPVVPAGEGAGQAPREPAVPAGAGRILRAADPPAAAGGAYHRRAEDRVAEHAGRAEQLVQYAGRVDFGGFRRAGAVAGAGGAGVYGVRRRRQLRPAQL